MQPFPGETGVSTLCGCAEPSAVWVQNDRLHMMELLLHHTSCKCMFSYLKGQEDAGISVRLFPLYARPRVTTCFASIIHRLLWSACFTPVPVCARTCMCVLNLGCFRGCVRTIHIQRIHTTTHTAVLGLWHLHFCLLLCMLVCMQCVYLQHV